MKSPIPINKNLMKPKALCTFIFLIIIVGYTTGTTASELVIRENEEEILLEVVDEGDSGALVLPVAPLPPEPSSNSLGNVNGVLYWNDAQLGTGWQKTDNSVHLIHLSDGVGVGLSEPSGDASIEVSGQLKITGGSPSETHLLVSDAEGLATWQKRFSSPGAIFLRGPRYFQLSATPRLVSQISIIVPGNGTVVVSATGYAYWTGSEKDSMRICFTESTTPEIDTDTMMERSDLGCTDTIDQYASWQTRNVFAVTGAGTHTFYLWADAPLTNNYNPCVDPVNMDSPSGCGSGGPNDFSQTRLDGTTLLAKYWPDE